MTWRSVRPQRYRLTRSPIHFLALLRPKWFPR